MNRRELIGSALAGLGVMESHTIVTPDASQPPLVILQVEQLTEEQAKVIHAQRKKIESHMNCRILIVTGTGSVHVPAAGQAKYGATETLDGYSRSIFCQTKEELDEWLKKNRTQ